MAVRAFDRTVLVRQASIVAGRLHAVMGAQCLVAPGLILPCIGIEIAERRREAIAAMLQRGSTERPQCVLQTLRQCHCTERARGYKPDGTLFRYLIEHAGVAKDEILHSGQSQFTDMVGGKPLGLAVAWINRRSVALHPSVPRPDFVFPDIASLIPLLEAAN
jgi:hypothetical protein